MLNNKWLSFGSNTFSLWENWNSFGKKSFSLREKTFSFGENRHGKGIEQKKIIKK